MKSNIETVSKFSDKELFEFVVTNSTMSAACLYNAALGYAELVRRGADVSRLRSAVCFYYPLIASGQIDVDAVMTFDKRTIKALCGMPLEQQKRLIAGEEIDVVVGDKVERLPLSRVPHEARDRVLRDGRILSPREQRLAMKTPRAKPESTRQNSVRIDPKSRTVKIANAGAPLDSFMAEVARVAGFHGEVIETKDRPARVIGVKVNEHEYERLHAKAKAQCIDVTEVMRQYVSLACL